MRTRVSTRQLQQALVDQRAVDVAHRWSEGFRPPHPEHDSPPAIPVQPGEGMTRPDS